MEPEMMAREDLVEPTLQVLSFSSLEEQVSTHLPDNSDPNENRQLLYALIGLGISCAMINGASMFITAKIPDWYALILNCIVIIGAFWVLYSKIRSEMPEIRNRRRISATELDEQSAGYKKIVAWLKTFPTRDLQEKLDFVQKRIETIELRSGALFGNVERLGLLTILVALYLQFKDATISWPPHISFSSEILIVAILSVYLASVWATSLKWQLNTYRQLLQLAMKPE